MSSLEKYDSIRHKLKDGDIILCHSTKPIAKAIQKVDEAYFHHSGVIFLKHGRVFVMDAHPDKGVNPGYLSHRIRSQKWDDFTVIRAMENKKRIEQAMSEAFAHASEYRGYDFKQIFKILRHRVTGYWDGNMNGDRDICSEFTQYYCIQLGLESHFPRNLKRPYFTPQDHIRVNDNDFKFIIE